ncbi:NADH-quinone oxidoreductase subunit A [Candidatus Ishikawella capsulata]|uniref:NADH-quinone oxidoreductase subunit A n=1 Tax=Candidatus Ishikawaella capsulata Mpkobe TaxID=476281 RepID=C5WC58_9ENTR|nr:NADH-quinone oxidoreductase subunit A [Candidatus Ishikawaella capsulata]BAH82914.1 NADH:ubiquinone oxidoreductase chain A [Candidatus Ishikawaella capsulata Mpkobe]
MFIYNIINISPGLWPFIVFIAIAITICSLMLISGLLLGGQSYSRYKQLPFESGINSVGTTHIRFSVKFYLIAMVFVIFDAEALFLYAWATSVRECGWYGFIEALIFILVIIISLFYLVKIGAFNWSAKKNKSLIRIDQ